MRVQNKVSNKFLVIAALFAVLVTVAAPVQAFEILAVDESNEPAEDVAFVLIPQGKAAAASEKPDDVEIVQKKYEFFPKITVVEKGTVVSFPNKDSSHHHVYSFSEAKQFEFDLFQGRSPEVTLDKEGVLSVGCNIHDWMLTYILVVDTPYSAVSTSVGLADFGHVPEGSYKVGYWTPGMDEKEGVKFIGTMNVKGEERGKLTIKDKPSFTWPEKPMYLPKEY